MTNTFSARSGLAALALLVATAGSHAQDVDRVGLHCQIPDGHHMIRTVEACPDGSGTQVETWDALSNSSWGRHLDWEPVSYMSFPYPVAICENGFVVDRRGEDQTEDWIATRTTLIADPGYQALLGEHTSHFIYARLLELEGAPAAEVSWQYLLSSWEADQCGMTDAYEAYVREYLRVASAELDAMTPEDELFTVYNLLVDHSELSNECVMGAGAFLLVLVLLNAEDWQNAVGRAVLGLCGLLVAAALFVGALLSADDYPELAMAAAA